MLGAGGNEVSDPPAVCEFCALSLRRTLAGHKSHRLLRVPPIRLLPVPESHARDDAAGPTRTGKTHRLTTCATGMAARGCPCPGAGVADKRSHGWRSEVSIERAKAWRAEVSVRRRARAAASLTCRCDPYQSCMVECYELSPPAAVFSGLPVVAAWWPTQRASMLGQVDCAGGQP